ncbi:ABC transporter permease subunit [Rathayibacter festucae]|uniref:ABC transporter permease n=2 Tax=Rathayibacter TaxID=33886 RepID=UPI001FB4ED76|nr:ABC transporter permease subunit [Rathayibacter festucae]MCJ1700289.1 ABC transporter permease subunit [Rathayibacter festucae]
MVMPLTGAPGTTVPGSTVPGAPGMEAPVPGGPASIRGRSNARGFRAARRSFRRHWQLYLLILPPLLYFIVFKYVPMSNAIIAFKDYNVIDGVWGSPWVGFKHFERFFSNPIFWTLLKNTFLLSAYVVLAGFPFPILLALALNEVRLRFFQRTVQMVTYAPYFISTVVVISMTILFLSPKLGPVSDVTSFFGLGAIDFLGDPDFFRHIYVFSDVWQTTGYSAVLYLAALSSIDTSLYEAARMDGASRLQKIWHVDIPGIMPTAITILILGVGNVMAIGFEKAFLLQNSLNLSQSEIIPTYVYKVGLLNADFSQAAAIGLFNGMINLVLLLGVNSLAKRITGQGLW